MRLPVADGCDGFDGLGGATVGPLANRGKPGHKRGVGRDGQDADATWAEWRSAVDRRLSELVPAVDGGAGRLSDAARYALLAPGKRLRPLLTMAAAAQFGAPPHAALDAGCAFEMVHAASLLLDDLPSMDDAALRRGRATAHRVHGEDLAVLAAVALLARAFGVLGAAEAIAPEGRLRLVARLSEAVGFDGLSAGQTRDLHERIGTAVEAALDRLAGSGG